MTAFPAAGDTGGTKGTGGTDERAGRSDGSPSLTQWLRSRDDADLVALLRDRPDLALPTPPDLATLATRLSVRTSVERAVDGLDAFHLRVLEALALAAGWPPTSGRAIAVADAAGLLGAPASSDGPEASPALAAGAVRRLAELALVWPDGEHVHLVSGVLEALGPYPAGLGRPARALLGSGSSTAALEDAGRLAETIASCDAAERALLDRLAAGPPVGTVAGLDRPAATRPPSPALGLLHRGLLAQLDARTVELPREVGAALRERPAGNVEPRPPEIAVRERSAAELDRAGGTAVLEMLRLTEALLAAWAEHPPRQLRAGGLGVRELHQTTAQLGVSESVVALVAETAAAAGLIGLSNDVAAHYLPTSDYDDWLRTSPAARWTRLATAWLDMTRQPSLADRGAGRRADRDRPANVLGAEAERGTAPALRAEVLDLLAMLPPGASPRDRAAVLDALEWQAPRRAARRRPAAEAVLAEADLLGVTAGGGLTGYSRTLRAGSRAVAEQVLADALPDPVDHFLVQPDLTLVVPGPPTAELAATLGRIADLESSGGASVYRITAATVRRALDTGRTAGSLHEFLQRHSRTPVPQALQYLIDDAARRHGALRTGSASSYLRSDDAALLQRATSDRSLQGLGLRLLAPTVAVSAVAVPRLLEALRAAGYAPAAEASDGLVVGVEPEPVRAVPRPPRPVRRRSVDSGQLAQIVRSMRSGDSLSAVAPAAARPAPDEPGSVTASAVTMGVLREAIRGGRPVLLETAVADGTTARHTIWPISMAGGFVRGHEPEGGRLASFPLHRLTRVVVLDDDEAR